jgi:sRNA-binding carbon storage regulator CsrA
MGSSPGTKLDKRGGNLRLSRRGGEQVYLFAPGYEPIIITLDPAAPRVKMAIKAPLDVRVARGEIANRPAA